MWKCTTFIIINNQMNFQYSSLVWAAVCLVPLVETYRRAHPGTNAQCVRAGRRVSGDGKPFLDILGAFRESSDGVKKAQFFPSSHFSSSWCANGFSWEPQRVCGCHDLNIVSKQTSQAMNKWKVHDRCNGRNRWICLGIIPLLQCLR